LPHPSGVIFGFEWYEQAKGEKSSRTQNDRYVVSLGCTRDSNCTGGPEACCRRGPANGAAALENRTATNEAHSRDHAFDNPGASLRTRSHCDLRREDKSTTRDGDQGKRPDSGGALRFLAFPPDRQREKIRDPEIKKVVESTAHVRQYTDSLRGAAGKSRLPADLNRRR
jgi:hypothetical protein